MPYIKKSFVPSFFRWMKKKKSGSRKFGMQFGKPNFENEWQEINDPKQYTRQTVYEDFFYLGKSKWITLAKTGKIVKYSLTQARSQIENTLDPSQPFDKLDKGKKENVLKQIDSGKIELSIVANYSDGFKFLVAGNTRLTAQMETFGEGYVWQFNVPDEVVI